MLHLALFVGSSLLALIVLIKFALWRVKSGKPGSSVYLSGDQEGYRAPTFCQDAVGKEGVALSDLGPSGHILVENKKLQAVSKSGYLEKGSEIVVLEGKGAYLLVRAKEI
jgi:membrane-bound serine protease (ClpP class)